MVKIMLLYSLIRVIKKSKEGKEMEELMKILEQVKPDVDFETETALIDDGILESFDIIAIVNEINDTFDVEITVAHLKPVNFNSAEAIWNLIQELQD